MRLARELDGAPPARLAEEAASLSKSELLKLIFRKTMGAKEAFGHRQVELLVEGRSGTDDDVVASYAEDVAPGGDLTRYLARATLAHREGDALFVHGGVTRENLFMTPNAPKSADIDGWMRALADFYGASIEAFVTERSDAKGRARWSDLVAYQSPIPGTRQNPTSLVYARPTNDEGDPRLPPVDVVRTLLENGIRRVVLGHTPSGDFPAVLRDGPFELVLADNSYARWERGSRVVIEGEATHVHGFTELDGGERHEIAHAIAEADRSPVGLRDEASGQLVKAPLDDGFVTFRALPNYAVEQRRVDRDAIASFSLGRAS